MRLSLKKTLAAAATVAAAATALPLLAAAPAGAVGPAGNNGPLTLAPQTGTGTTNFSLSFPSGAQFQCPGDSASGGYRVQGFVVPASQNLANMTFTSTGPVGGQPLITPAGDA